MKAILYKMTCITNLHVGNEGNSFSVVDKEVERDFDGTPIIHASGIKGALRSMMLNGNDTQRKSVNRIFGTSSNSGEGTGRGAFSFTDAHMLYRPLRVCDSSVMSSLPVTTVGMLKHFLKLTTDFGCCPIEPLEIDWAELNSKFGRAAFLSSVSNVRVEDEETAYSIPDAIKNLVESLLGKNFAIARSLDNYDLPVIARNRLKDGTSEQLWYEEYVPHDSCFYTIIMMPNEDSLSLTHPIQMGGNASVGYGYINMEQWGGEQND